MAAVNPGDVLAGRYRVERVLGEGRMGVVLAAQHLVLGERVAVKLLLPEAAGVEGVVSRFQREARAAARIQSEHVARLMDVGLTEAGTPYLVMECVEGRDLAAELENPRTAAARRSWCECRALFDREQQSPGAEPNPAERFGGPRPGRPRRARTILNGARCR